MLTALRASFSKNKEWTKCDDLYHHSKNDKHVWLGLATKNSCKGLGKDHGLR